MSTKLTESRRPCEPKPLKEPSNPQEALTEAQLASFTDRLKNLQTPVIELQMPPNQALLGTFKGLLVSFRV